MELRIVAKVNKINSTSFHKGQIIPARRAGASTAFAEVTFSPGAIAFYALGRLALEGDPVGWPRAFAKSVFGQGNRTMDSPDN